MVKKTSPTVRQQQRNTGKVFKTDSQCKLTCVETVAGTGTTSKPTSPNKSSIPPVLFETAKGAEVGTIGAVSPKKSSLGWLAEEATMIQGQQKRLNTCNFR
jgi:hypothetical protein